MKKLFPTIGTFDSALRAFALVILLAAAVCILQGCAYNSLLWSLTHPWSTEQWVEHDQNGGGGAPSTPIERSATPQ